MNKPSGEMSDDDNSDEYFTAEEDDEAFWLEEFCTSTSPNGTVWIVPKCLPPPLPEPLTSATSSKTSGRDGRSSIAVSLLSRR